MRFLRLLRIIDDSNRFKAFCIVCMKETWIVDLQCTKCGTSYG